MFNFELLDNLQLNQDSQVHINLNLVTINHLSLKLQTYIKLILKNLKLFLIKFFLSQNKNSYFQHKHLISMARN